MSQKKLLLVDGSSYLYRAFYGSSDLRTKAGVPTGAIFGVLSMLRALISKNQPDLFAVIFDPPGPTLRMDWYEDYKANRSKMPEELIIQVEPLKEIIKSSGYSLIEIPKVEADDVIGTLALQGANKGYKVFIASGDKDMAQLVSSEVTVIDDQKNSIWDEKGVLEKFGVKADQIVDYLTLVGDSSDNIPGVPKVGPKTAVKWLNEYQNLNSLIRNKEKIKGKVGENLRQFEKQIPLTKQLVTILTEIDVGVEVGSLKIIEADKERLESLYRQYEFKTFLGELSEAQDSDKKFIKTVSPKTNYETIFTTEALMSWISRLNAAKLMAFDLETTSLDPLEADIVGLSFSVNTLNAVYIPLGHDYDGVEAQLDLSQTLAALKPVLENKKRLKVGHNLKYDRAVLKNYGISLEGIAFDTMLESYIFDSSVSRHDLKSVAKRYLDIEVTEFADIVGKDSKNQSFSQVQIEVATRYAAEDADVSLRLHKKLFSDIRKTGRLESLLAKVEVPLVPVLSDMERSGVHIDANMLSRQGKYLAEVMQKKEDEAHKEAGESFNLASPKQIQELLFEKLQLPVVSKTPKGQPSTSESALSELAVDYVLPKLILEHRSLSKLKSTYVDKLPTQISPVTGRVHTNYHQAVTTTGRLSSSDPNLQNIPIRTPEGRKIRKAFSAPDGRKIVAADYSQIELRIMAHLSKDDNLIGAFRDGADIHSATASEVFGVSLCQVSEENRRAAKAINFGLIYGMSAFGLSKQLGIGRYEAQEYINLYFSKYPKVREYMEKTRVTAKEKGFVETVYGRRLYLPNIESKQAKLRQYAERAAINAPMQGTAADIIKIAMINTFNWLNEKNIPALLIMQVHDELVFEVESEAVSQITEELNSLMVVSGDELDVPLEVTIGTGFNWDEAH